MNANLDSSNRPVHSYSLPSNPLSAYICTCILPRLPPCLPPAKTYPESKQHLAVHNTMPLGKLRCFHVAEPRRHEEKVGIG